MTSARSARDDGLGLGLGLGLAALTGCFGLVENTSGHGFNVAGGSATSQGSGSSATSDGGSRGAAVPTEGVARPGAASGLPCEIDEMLATHCRSCHGGPLKAPMPLLAYADLLAAAVSDPNRKVAELALERMQSQTAPMPPAGLPSVPAEQRDAFAAWLASGAPRGECGAPGAGGATSSTAKQPVVCTSDSFWPASGDGDHDGLDAEGPWMSPGRACISCHLETEDKGPIVQIGGTVYPSLHEQDLCYGIDGPASAARVIITDAVANTFELPVGRTGNFALELKDQSRVVFPIRAKVVAAGRERAMSVAQHTGDCNSCHTEQGRNGAPGRILLP